MDFKEIECDSMYLIQVSQERSQWRILANKIMNSDFINRRILFTYLDDYWFVMKCSAS
jgi:hypothetical protein